MRPPSVEDQNSAADFVSALETLSSVTLNYNVLHNNWRCKTPTGRLSSLKTD